MCNSNACLGRGAFVPGRAEKGAADMITGFELLKQSCVTIGCRKVADWILHIFFEDGSETYRPYCEECGKEREQAMKKEKEKKA